MYEEEEEDAYGHATAEDGGHECCFDEPTMGRGKGTLWLGRRGAKPAVHNSRSCNFVFFVVVVREWVQLHIVVGDCDRHM